MVILAEPIDAPIEVAEDRERNQLLSSRVDPGLERGPLRGQGQAVGCRSACNVDAVDGPAPGITLPPAALGPRD